MMKGFGGGAMAQAGGLASSAGCWAAAGARWRAFPRLDARGRLEPLGAAGVGALRPGGGRLSRLGAPAVSHGGTKGAKGSGKKKKKGGAR